VREKGLTLPDEEAALTSVTALEVQAGILLADPAARRRCRVCIRVPLPYDDSSALGRCPLPQPSR